MSRCSLSTFSCMTFPPRPFAKATTSFNVTARNSDRVTNYHMLFVDWSLANILTRIAGIITELERMWRASAKIKPIVCSRRVLGALLYNSCTTVIFLATFLIQTLRHTFIQVISVFYDRRTYVYFRLSYSKNLKIG